MTNQDSTAGRPAPSPKRGMRDGLSLYTVEDLVTWGACYSREDLEELARGQAEFTMLDVLNATHLRTGEKLWVVLRPEVLTPEGAFHLGADFLQHAASEIATAIESLSEPVYHSQALRAARAISGSLTKEEASGYAQACGDEYEDYTLAERKAEKMCDPLIRELGDSLMGGALKLELISSVINMRRHLARGGYLLMRERAWHGDHNYKAVSLYGDWLVDVSRYAVKAVGETGLLPLAKGFCRAAETGWQLGYLQESFELQRGLYLLQNTAPERFRSLGAEFVQRMAAGIEDMSDLVNRVIQSIGEEKEDDQ